jgi:hypothetical protein
MLRRRHRPLIGHLLRLFSTITKYTLHIGSEFEITCPVVRHNVQRRDARNDKHTYMFTMKKLPLSVIAASAALFASTEAKALVVVIDDFSTAQIVAPFPNGEGPGTHTGSTSGAGIIGSERELALTKTTLPTLNDSSTLALSVGAGILGVNAGPGVAHSFRAIWDGSSDTVNSVEFGLTGVDVIDQVNGGNLANTFFSFVADVDLSNSSKVSVKIYKDAGNYSTYTTGFLTGGGTPTQYDIALASFASVGTGANFDDIKAIELLVTSLKPSTDLNFSVLDFSYTPVPEVSTAASAGAFALLGGLVLLRARKTSAKA